MGWMWIYVCILCMCICIFVRMYICMHVAMTKFVLLYGCASRLIHARESLWMHVWMHAYACARYKFTRIRSTKRGRRLTRPAITKAHRSIHTAHFYYWTCLTASWRLTSYYSVCRRLLVERKPKTAVASALHSVAETGICCPHPGTLASSAGRDSASVSRSRWESNFLKGLRCRFWSLVSDDTPGRYLKLLFAEED